MASLDELRKERIKKLEILKNNGINPYPISVDREFTTSAISEDFTKLSKRKKPLTVAGRVMSYRNQGKLVFMNIDDGTGSIQGMLKKDEVGEDIFKLFTTTVDIGDFVSLKGSLFTTKTKQKTILVKDWTMIAKSLRPLPDKWAGLKDTEERFRKRYLDTLMSKGAKERFILRSKIITELRNILNENEYLEVETPVLQSHAGGATANPFITHHNALDIDLYLRIAPELYLKRLLVGGFPKVYEIGRNFRNEGIDIAHNPEFTMLEFYESYSDKDMQMVFVEKLLKDVAKKTLGTTTFKFGENKINLSKKFARVTYYDLLKRYALITNPDDLSKTEIGLKAKQLGVDVSKEDSVVKILDNIYKKVCRPKIIDPTFVIDYPVHALPLAKRKEDNKNIVDAFQVVICGIELLKAFSELNDPIDQAERFTEQEKDKKAGDSEAQTTDVSYLEAMEHGMPPSSGVGIGIERLVMLFTDTHNIRDVILFPTLRPKD